MIIKDELILGIPMDPIRFPWECDSRSQFHGNGNGLMGIEGNENSTFSHFPPTDS